MSQNELDAYGVKPGDRAKVERYYEQARGVRLEPDELRECKDALGRWIRAESNQSPQWQDAVYTFFQDCYHLKDWVKNDPAAPNQSAVEKFITNSASLSLCADICNGSKHLKLTSSRSGGTPQLKGYEASFRPIQSSNWRKYYGTIRVESNGKVHDAFDLAQQCISEWKTFLGL
jgi:hypothetical protein